MSMIDKRILLVGKETFMYPFYFLVDEWNEKNEVATFWINPIESELEECDLNSSTYYAFVRKGKTKNYTLGRATSVFTHEINNMTLDMLGIQTLETKYSHFKGLNIQLISDQMMTGHYHYRTMYNPVTYEQQLRWIQLVYKDIEDILDEFNPDVIFDCDIAELPRTVLNEIANYRKIPYISIAYPRYELYKIPSYTLSQGIEDYLVHEYKKCLKMDNLEEIKYVEEFRNRNSIKNAMYMVKGNATYRYSAEPLIDTLKDIYGKLIYFYKQDKIRKNKKLKRDNSILFVNSYKYMKFWIKTQMFRRKLYKSSKYFEDPIEGESYVYMPLHMIPESTTFSIAPFWINELSAIEAVSKSLPAGWHLYVKEHQAMLGERGKDFYSKVKRIPNVKLVRFNYYDDPKPWIDKAMAVVTITGTSAYEAVLMGKPAFIFGDTPFSIIKGITRIKCIEDLPNLLRNFKKVDNIHECAAYIKAVKQIGTSVNIGYIMNSAYYHLTLNLKLEDEFFKEIEKLKDFFESSYEKFYEHKHLHKDCFEDVSLRI